jgi:hypothetical protein
MLVAVALVGCSSKSSPSSVPGRDAGAPVATAIADAAEPADAGPELPAHLEFPTLAKAIVAILPPDARVVGFGELHIRIDRPGGRPALARFRADILPELAPMVSDLVLETWIVDPKCGATAQEATARVESAMQRPEATKTDLAATIEAAQGANIKVHAMRLGCADYDKVAPKGAPVAVEVLLDLVTRELGRIAASAIAHRDKEGAERPLIAVYGGALHNDRFPIKSVAAWSYAAAVDKASGDRYVEIDLIAPELAAQDALSAQAEWFPLVAAATHDRVQVFERGPRSFVIILPTS